MKEEVRRKKVGTYMRTRDYITTYSGHTFSPLAPDADAIDLRDVAHALALISREYSHFVKFYTVG